MKNKLMKQINLLIKLFTIDPDKLKQQRRFNQDFKYIKLIEK